MQIKRRLETSAIREKKKRKEKVPKRVRNPGKKGGWERGSEVVDE